MKKTLTIGLASAALLTAGLAAMAHAQSGPDQTEGWGGKHGERRAMMRAELESRLAEIDTNGDGEISRQEADARRAADFAAADTDASGGLSPDEAEAWREARMAERKARRAAARFDRADADGDGVIGPDEFDRRQEEMFNRMDADEDGAITQAEIEDGLREMGRKHGKRRFGRGERE